MRRQHRKPKLTFPAEFSGNAVAVCVEVEMLPLLCGLLRKWEGAEPWETDDDWEQGYQWVLAFQECLMANCLQTLIDEQQRLYRLIDSSMNGQVYTVTGIDPQTSRPIISPELPDVPAQLTHPALRPLLNRAYNAPLPEDWPDDTPGMLEVLRNFQGTINAGWFGLGGEKATIANVVEALRVGNNQTREDIWDKLYGILVSSSSGANIIDLLADFFTDTVDAGLEGGILAMQIASAMAGIAAQIKMQDRLDRIIQALDGGATTAPTSETHNAVLLLDQIKRKLIEADPDNDSLLEEIRKLLV